jgi:hypothetical protein
VKKAQTAVCCGVESAPVLEGAFEQVVGALDVGADEVAGPVYRAVDVGFGCEIDDRARLMFREQTRDESAVCDVPVNEDVALVAFEGDQVLGIACVSERVEVHHALIAPAQPFEHEVRTDEAGAAGDE